MMKESEKKELYNNFNNIIKKVSRNKNVMDNHKKEKLLRRALLDYKKVHKIVEPWLIGQMALTGYYFKTVVSNKGVKLYYYYHGIFTPHMDFLKITLDKIYPEYKESQLPDILRHITASADRQYLNHLNNKNLIACKNGIFDRKPKGIYAQFQDYDTLNPKDYFITNKIITKYPNENDLDEIKNTKIKDIIDDRDYSNSFLNESVPKFINRFFYQIADYDKDTETQMKQEILDCLEPNYSHGKAVINYGASGSNGKSNLTQLIMSIVGMDNVASVPINKLNDKNSISTLDNSFCNLSDDMGDNPYLKDDSNFKSLINGGQIEINKKYEKPYVTKLSLTNVQNTNVMPRFEGSGNYINRRLQFIPFENQFNPKDKGYIDNETMLQLLRSAPVREWVLYRVLNQPKFTHYQKSQKSDDLLSDCTVSNDPVKAFYKDYKEYFDKLDRIPKNVAFKVWKQYADRNNFKSMTATKFKYRFSAVTDFSDVKRTYYNEKQRDAVDTLLTAMKSAYDVTDLPKVNHSYMSYVK